MGKSGIGMPAALKLERFAEVVRDAFDGEVPYQVGSSLETTAWRDVDVRVMLDDEAYARWGFGDPAHTHSNAKWAALVLAFSALGREMTGLPIDFQVQQTTHANAQHDGPRSALGIRRQMAHVHTRYAATPAPDATEEEAELREYRRHRHSTTTDRERAREQGFNEEFGEYPAPDGRANCDMEG